MVRVHYQCSLCLILSGETESQGGDITSKAVELISDRARIHAVHTEPRCPKLITLDPKAVIFQYI